MPTYVILYKWSEQGIKNVKYSTIRAEATSKAVEAAGGKVIGLWYTMGEYDIVAVVEWPSEQIAIAFLLTHASQDFVRATTLPARTPSEFAEIMKMIP